MNKLFQRCVSALPQSLTSNGVLLLTVLQFFLDFREVVLHDADASLSAFFRSCLSREFADTVVAEHALEFLNANTAKILRSHPSILPQVQIFIRLLNGKRLIVRVSLSDTVRELRYLIGRKTGIPLEECNIYSQISI
ncbi:uncharacterized protein LOC109716781 isoform X1 [Ananas comosus]|uniref:Uncharacterized protein LOC109716781 isoform X1 n=1 Tax=Ananas comosus TaxID=4615 RepID=A0A6P5FPL1_ANACO|nr:uncharacterized protein LOC109716781 isoform X1 [Ananas comosus]